MILTGENKVLRKRNVQVPFLNHKSHTDWPGIETERCNLNHTYSVRIAQ